MVKAVVVLMGGSLKVKVVVVLELLCVTGRVSARLDWHGIYSPSHVLFMGRLKPEGLIFSSPCVRSTWDAIEVEKDCEALAHALTGR